MAGQRLWIIGILFLAVTHNNPWHQRVTAKSIDDTAPIAILNHCEVLPMAAR
jgi:hypothetical protein